MGRISNYVCRGKNSSLCLVSSLVEWSDLPLVCVNILGLCALLRINNCAELVNFVLLQPGTADLAINK